MQRVPPPADPDAYLAALDGWRLALAKRLRAAALADGRLEERIKWDHLVYLHAGPVLLIRAEAARVLFGFWRGARLLHLEPRLKGTGRYELRTLDLREGDDIDDAAARRLVAQAATLNESLGDPTRRG